MSSVAIIGTRGYPSYYGGFETLIRHLAPYLVDDGWDVTVYSRPSSVKTDDPNLDHRIKTITTWGMDSRSLSTLSYGLSSSLHACFRKKPDVALIMNVANGYFLPLFMASHIPTIVNVDGIEWEREKWGSFAKSVFRVGARLTARNATHLVFDAKAIADKWKKDFGKYGTFIPYGADVPKNLPVEPGLTHRGYILYVARFVPENTFSVFLEAAKVLSKQWPVVIVGSSGYGGPLDAEVAQLSTTNPNIHWLGQVSDDQRLYSLWQHAGAYFHGHSVGGTNPALVQALGCGAPIVARDTVYNREVIADAGMFVSPDASQIITTLADLMNVTNDNLSRAAVSRAENQYSWSKVQLAYCQLLREACRESS